MSKRKQNTLHNFLTKRPTVPSKTETEPLCIPSVSGTSEPRAKRQKFDKKGRFAAFEKLKSLKGKGSMYKYEVAEMENVYEEVDEREYTKKVLSRQDDDWIVDDDGSGYVEDGRDIFDDDLDDDSIISASRSKKKNISSGKRGRTNAKVAAEHSVSGGSNIRNMLMNMPSKKAGAVNMDDDDILGDIMEELNNGNCKKPSAPKRPKPPSPRSYIRSLSAGNRVKPTPTGLNGKSVKRSIAAKWNLEESDLIESSDTQTQQENCNGTVGSQTIEDSDSEDAMQFNSKDHAHSLNKKRSAGAGGMVKGFKKKEDEVDTVIDDDTQDDEWSVKVKRENVKDDVVDTTLPSEETSHNYSSQLGEASAEMFQEMEDDFFGLLDEESFGQQLSESNAELEKMKIKHEDTSKTDLFFDNWHGEQENAPSYASCSNLGDLPLTKTDNGEVLHMYWLDAYEDPVKRPGTVFLFGKVWVEAVGHYVSCCVTVDNIERQIFLLPREKKYSFVERRYTDEDVKFVDVYEEFNTKISSKYDILQFKCRRVERNYAFSIPDIPVRSEYMEIRYLASFQRLPPDLQGETFSHTFGTTTPFLERLLLERKMKGPCWLNITNPQHVKNPVSWCKIVASCELGDVVVCPTIAPPPPLVVATVNVRTVVNQKKHWNELVMISCLVHNEFPIEKAAPKQLYQQHFCAFTRPSDTPWPHDLEASLSKYSGTKFEKCDSERAMLSFFVTKLARIDPDLIVGHDIVGYYWDMIVARCAELKVPNFSRLGRLKRSLGGESDYEKKKRVKETHTGRLMCDVKISAKELIKSRSYDLETLCKDVLHINEDSRQELNATDILKMYTSSIGLIRLMSCTMQDAAYALRLFSEMNVLPLALQITAIAGNVLSRTLLGGRSERNEFLLLHAFTEKEYIVPDKYYEGKKLSHKQPKAEDGYDDEESLQIPSISSSRSAARAKRKPAYAGGLVLEPKKGFYDTFVLLMDFNSLYPSIIQEYNICFTTMPTQNNGEEETLPEAGLPPGVLPTEIRRLVESRREVKKLMNVPDISPDLRLQYNIRQMALKLTANSMYGCLGFASSRFYAQNLAALVTAKGRETLINTKSLVEKMNHEVIYGDTDSLMINTKSTEYDQVFKIGQKIKAEVNRLYKQVELEIDGVFRYLLLLKKKKYAAVTITRLPNGTFTTTQEMKGLDIVRRDWSQLSAQAGKYILEQILSDLGPDERIERIHSHLAKLRTDLEARMVPMELLVITKQLTKAAAEYADSKSLPHVQVALRINSKTPNKIRPGDTVPYIICEDTTNNSATQRAYHLDEVKADPALKPDVQYYLAQQIHPVISRLCEPIEGTDGARIAECLGLDPSKYVKVVAKRQPDDEAVGENAQLSVEEKFKYCDRFTFKCMSDTCSSEVTVDGAYRKEDSCYALQRCVNPACRVAPINYLANIQNRLTLALRSAISKYYQKWMVCEDPGCENRTRSLPLELINLMPRCQMCKGAPLYKEYSCTELYTQLCYYQHIFDLSKVTEKNCMKPSPELDAAYMHLMEQVDRTLRHSGYSVIDLGSLFDGLQLSKVSKPPVS